MNICLIEPYYSGSHAAWLDGIVRNSSHNVSELTLPGRFWKWRMHGGAITLARAFRSSDLIPDLCIATDMLDLPTFQALTRHMTTRTRYAVYFHENQLTYPLQSGEKRDFHYAFINYASALSADHVWFNSSFHRESFLSELPRYLKHFPDYNQLDTAAEIREKSSVLPVGIDLQRLDKDRPDLPRSGPLHIVWNHRWEYDKLPHVFFDAMYALQSLQKDFRLIVLGENYRKHPEEFVEAHRRLADHIAHFGYVHASEDYASLLWKGDVVVSTAIQDFFGVSTCEAIYAGCFPFLPDRLNYPSLVPEGYHDMALYKTRADLIEKLSWACDHVHELRQTSLRQAVVQFDWSNLIPLYDKACENVVNKS